MSLSLHTACFEHLSLSTIIKIAQQTGYDGIEICVPKIEEAIHEGYSINDLKIQLKGLKVSMLDVLLSFERIDYAGLQDSRKNCERMAELAACLNCPAIQIVALQNFSSTTSKGILDQLAFVLPHLSEIAGAYGVRLALEPVSFSPFNNLNQAIKIVRIIGPDRIGLVLDTWHLWTAGASWKEVAAIPAELIECAHLGDCYPKQNRMWQDEDRYALPGSGVVPLAEAVAAIHQTGFDGSWAVEVLGEKTNLLTFHELAAELRNRALNFIG